MSRPTANLRLFVAAYPPIDLARAMIERLQTLALPHRSRLTPIEQAHLTLQFVGDTPASEMEQTIESVRRAAAGLRAFTLTLQRLIALPERGPSRLIAAETDAPATLMELQKRLAMRLATNVRDKPGRGYRPHITLCRFASPMRAFALQEAAAELEGAFAVERIVLIRSTLSHEGARHYQVAGVMLA